LFGKGDHAQAIEDFNRAIKLDPAAAETYQNRARVYDALAAADREEARRLDTLVPEVPEEQDSGAAQGAPSLQPPPNDRQHLQRYVDIVNKGIDYYERGDMEGALIQFNKAINFDPSYAGAYANRGGLYNTKKNLDLALTDLNEAIRLDPNFAPAYANRGSVHYNRKDYESAREDWEQTLCLDPQFPGTRKKLEDLCQLIKDQKSAEIMRRGNNAASKGNLDQAIADYTEAARIDPLNANIYLNRGTFYNMKNDLDRSLADFNEAVRLNPKYTDAYINRGNLYGAFSATWIKLWSITTRRLTLGLILR
jgi:tetratricopeptide (TPR) repeat protein